MHKFLISLMSLSLIGSLTTSLIACDDDIIGTRSLDKWGPWITDGSIPGDDKLVEPPVRLDNEYLVGTEGNGFYKSKDGLHWQKANFFSDQEVGPVFVKPFQIGNTYFIAMNDTGLWMSKDLKTWTRNSTKAFKTWQGLQVNPVQINKVWYFGTQSQGLWKSTDQGQSWIQVGGKNNLPTSLEITHAPFVVNNHYFVGTNKGLWTSTDQGANWTLVGGANNLPTKNISFPTAITTINNHYFIGTNNQGLWTSTDLTNWTQVSGAGNLPAQTGIQDSLVEYNKTYFLTTVADSFGLGSQGVWESKDGLKWTHMTGSKYNLPPKIEATRNITLLRGVYYLASMSSGLWTSTNGIKWTQNLDINSIAEFVRPPEIVGQYYYLASFNQGLYLKQVDKSNF